MKFISAILLTALLSYVGGLYMDWWVIAIAALLVSVSIPQKPIYAFLAGFISLFLLWGILAFYIDMKNNHLLSSKISELLFKMPSYWLIILVTGLIGGLVAGLAALTGSFIRKNPA